MNRTALKPLLNLAAAAVFAQSAAMPAWGEQLLSCGFTNALRIIQSADEIKRHSAAKRSADSKKQVDHPKCQFLHEVGFGRAWGNSTISREPGDREEWSN